MTPTHPKFSVVIPLYNKADTIISTVRSVLDQSFSEFELVIVDDGSTDDGVARISDILDPRIRLIRQPNAGVSNARNTGMKMAEAAHIAFLDGDDLWDSYHLEELASLISQYAPCGVYSTGHRILRNGKNYYPSSGVDGDFRGQVKDVFSTFSHGLSLINSSTACVKKTALMAMGGFPEGIRFGEDVYVWLRLGHECGMAHSARVTATYRQEMVSREIAEDDSELPYYLPYLDLLRLDKSQSLQTQASVTELMRGSIIINAANMRMIGRSSALKALYQLKIFTYDFRLRIFWIVLHVTPISLLKLARKYRHSDKDS